MGFIWKTYKQQVIFDRFILPGLTPRSLKHHYSLIPIHVCTVVAFAWASYCSWRFLVYHPDSLMSRRDNYERYRDGTDFLFCNITGLKIPSEAPIYRKEGDPSDESYASPEW